MSKNKNGILLIIFSLILCFSLNGCALILSSSYETVSFNSEPTGASILVNGDDMGKTPTKLELKRKNNHIIEYRLKGYETKTTMLNHSIRGGFVVLDVLFGVVPLVFDAIGGHWFRFDKIDINMTLEKK